MTTKRGLEDDRQVVPRWRTFELTVQSGELSSTNPAEVADVAGELDLLRLDFRSDPNLFTAADLLGALISANAMTDAEAKEIATYILGFTSVPGVLREQAEHVAFGTRIGSQLLSSNPADSASLESVARRRVRLFRRLLLTEPLNAVRWIDLALAHSTLGNTRKARKAAEAALQLQPDNRFVLRASARLFIHLDDPERAHSALAATPRSDADPWLAAALLSASHLADGALATRSARELLISDNFRPFDLSELASELGTLELGAGHSRSAKRLFEQALRDPNENTVAQASNLSEKADVGLRPELLSIAGGHEARAIMYSREGNWMDATREAEVWAQDQPFAVGPALFGSYAASVGAGLYETALDLAQSGLRANPNEPNLRNNAAFALANMGRAVDALRLVPDRSETDGLDAEVSQATLGLIYFRLGDVDQGRRLYDAAVQEMAESGERQVAAIAMSLWAYEERRAGTTLAEHVSKISRDAADRFPSPEAKAVQQRIKEL